MNILKLNIGIWFGENVLYEIFGAFGFKGACGSGWSVRDDDACDVSE